MTLSDLSVLLIEKKPIAMAETLTLLVVKEQTLHLQHILQVKKDHSRIIEVLISFLILFVLGFSP